MIELLIVIPAHNEQETVEDCIDSLNRLTVPCDVHATFTFILDRCTDNTKKILDRKSAAYVEKNFRGDFVNPIGEVVDFAMSQIPSDWVMKVDADVRLNPDTLEKLINYLSSGYACVSAKISTRTNSRLLNALYMLRDLSLKFTPLGAKLFGGCILFKKAAVEEIGGFSHDAPRWDTGFEQKLNQFGLKTAVANETVIEHRDFQMSEIIQRQKKDGQARREMHIGFFRTLLHSIIRGRPFVIYGYLKRS